MSAPKQLSAQNNMQKKKEAQINFKFEKGKITEFLQEWVDVNQKETTEYGRHKYKMLIGNLANRQSERLEISFRDLEEFFRNKGEENIPKHILSNTKRYEEIFNQAVFQIMPKRNKDITPEEKLRIAHETTLWDQRMSNFQDREARERGERLPLRLYLHYNTYFVKERPQEKALSVGKLNAKMLGHSVAVRALVVRMTDIKPQMIVATYNCDLCGHEIYQDVDGRPDFLPLTECVSRVCVQRMSHGKISIQPGTSKMVAYQEIKVQETSDQLEEGGVPRTFTIIAKRDNVRQCSPGDIVFVQGTLLPLEKSGRKRANFQYSSYIEAAKITRQKQRFADLPIDDSVHREVQQLRNRYSDEDLFNYLAQSISPEVYGMLSIKKALLLQLVGGSGVSKGDGMRIRGDINIALIGDPGVAKSQFLKRVSYLSPRGVYTTGKGSSGVGLTASIKRDPVTNELTLEGGALVLADTGICCIDEFDKMEENDRTAIHEVMEQQSVSIAKAGIVASLNARSSILAAANPFYGRYDRNRTVQENIKLPAALMSRFDLIFLLLDNITEDEALSRKILNTHMRGQQTNNLNSTLLRAYIALAKRHEPIIEQSLQKIIAEKYVQLRNSSDTSKETRVTPRNLLALLRLASARAKLRFDKEVREQDFNEAVRLMQQTKIMGLSAVDLDLGFNKQAKAIHTVYKVISQVCNTNPNRQATLAEIKPRINAIGLNEKDIEECINHFTKMGSLMLTEEGRIKLVLR